MKHLRRSLLFGVSLAAIVFVTFWIALERQRPKPKPLTPVLFLQYLGLASLDWEDNEHVALGTLSDTFIYEWKTDHVEFPPKLLTGANYIVFAPNKSILAGCHRDIWLWDKVHGVRTLTTTSGYTTCTHLAWNADGSMIAASTSGINTEGNAIKIWDANTGDLIKTLQGDNSNPAPAGEAGFSTVSWSPTGQLLLSDPKEANNAVRVWDAVSGKAAAKFQSIDHTKKAVAFSPNGKYLAVGNPDLTISVIDINSAQTIKSLPAKQSSINLLAWNFDSTRLASASTQGSSVLVWDVGSGQVVADLAEDDTVSSLEWQHNSNKLLILTRASVRIWDTSISTYTVVQDGAAIGYIARWSLDDSLLAVVNAKGLAIFAP